jgi:hypothetical protein
MSTNENNNENGRQETDKKMKPTELVEFLLESMEELADDWRNLEDKSDENAHDFIRKMFKTVSEPPTMPIKAETERRQLFSFPMTGSRSVDDLLVSVMDGMDVNQMTPEVRTVAFLALETQRALQQNQFNQQQLFSQLCSNQHQENLKMVSLIEALLNQATKCQGQVVQVEEDDNDEPAPPKMSGRGRN